MKSRVTLLCAGLLAAVSIGLTACQSDSAELLVSYATMKVIERGNTAEDQVARAEKIRDIANDAKFLLKGEVVSVGVLEQTIREQVHRLDLSPADMFLADSLIRQVAVELQERVGTGVLDPEKRLKVTKVLDWVITATAYGGSYNAGSLEGAAAGGG